MSHDIIKMDGEYMIIKYKTDKKYTEPEIHVCTECKDIKAKEIYDKISDVFEQKLKVYDGEQTYMILQSDIIRIYSADKQVFVSTLDRQYRIKERLYEMEDRLKKDKFVRISNSEIVNVGKIKKLDTGMTGTIKMYLKGDIETYVSRRYVPKIKQALGI